MHLAARTLMLLAPGLLALAPAQAELTQKSATSFTATFREEIRASAEEAWPVMLQLPRWWTDEHTYSGKAANLSLDARPGGCWCETWPGGQIKHARVLMVMNGRTLRLHGNLGPLQALPVQGVLLIGTAVRDGKTTLQMVYRVGGPPDVGLEDLAPAVDRVMGEQFKRLKAAVESSRP